jgi:hypothetical protein
MTTKIATTTFTTQLANLPSGVTPQEGYLVELFKDAVLDPASSATVPDDATPVMFTISEPGTYFVAVSRLATDGAVIGTASSELFSLDQDQVSVPLVVTVSLSDPVPVQLPATVKVKVK